VLSVHHPLSTLGPSPPTRDRRPTGKVESGWSLRRAQHG